MRDYQFLVDYIGVNKSEISRRDFTMVYDSYDDCIAFLDDQLGRLLGELERRRILDDTVVIITSDHGEAFGEHGYCGHAYAVEIQEVGVPLVILAPGAPAGRSVPTAVTLRDLPATVTDLLGMGEGSPFPGRSLADYWRLPPGEVPSRFASPAFSEKADETVYQTPRGESVVQMSLVAPYGYQYTRTSDGVEALFNLWRDPKTLFNLIGSADGDAMLGKSRRMLLDVLNETPGSPESERRLPQSLPPEARRPRGKRRRGEEGRNRIECGGGAWRPLSPEAQTPASSPWPSPRGPRRREASAAWR